MVPPLFAALSQPRPHSVQKLYCNAVTGVPGYPYYPFRTQLQEVFTSDRLRFFTGQTLSARLALKLLVLFTAVALILT